MQALLNDIELDVQELKYLLDVVSKDSASPLRSVAKRSILQMHAHLDMLSKLLEEKVVLAESSVKPEATQISLLEAEVATDEVAVVAIEDKVEAVSTEYVLGERIKPGDNLRRSISLNDSFRFSRELFGGDNDLMNKVVQQIGEMSSMEAALIFLTSKIKVDEENEATADFLELLKKYFN